MKFPLPIALFAGLLCQSLAAQVAENKEKPNVIVVLADDLGYGDLGCYGAKPEHVKTPQIDRLAAEGLRFTDGHSTASVCTPSRYSLLTGSYAFRNRLGSSILPGDAPLSIAPGSFTLPEMFRKQGYATGFVGKWHLGLGQRGKLDWNGEIKPGPAEIGFDSSFFFPATGDRVPTVFIRNHRVVNLDPADPISVCYNKKSPIGETFANHPELATVLKGLPRTNHNDAVTEGVTRMGFMSGGKAARWKDQDIADTFAGEVTKFLEEHKKQPFFLYYATHNIHEPRVPHPRFVGKSGIGSYGDQIVELDAVIGKLLDDLKRLGIDDKTIIVFSSDNGPSSWLAYDYGDRANFAGHKISGALRGEKGTLWEGGTRVPFIVRWKGHVEGGKSSEALVSQADLLASFASLLGVSLPENAAPDSENVLPALLGKSPKGREELLEHLYGRPNCALRQGTWKLFGGKLFDLSKDIGETQDLSSAEPERAKAMAERQKELIHSKRTRK